MCESPALSCVPTQLADPTPQFRACEPVPPTGLGGRAGAGPGEGQRRARRGSIRARTRPAWRVSPQQLPRRPPAPAGGGAAVRSSPSKRPGLSPYSIGGRPARSEAGTGRRRREGKVVAAGAGRLSRATPPIPFTRPGRERASITHTPTRAVKPGSCCFCRHWLERAAGAGGGGKRVLPCSCPCSSAQTVSLALFLRRGGGWPSGPCATGEFARSGGTGYPGARSGGRAGGTRERGAGTGSSPNSHLLAPCNVE